MTRLPREEYVEQAYLFGALGNRLETNEPIQVLLEHLTQELLATTKLPMAIDYLLAELKHSGSISEAMTRMKHYFAPFQAFLFAQAEDERGRIDIFTVLKILEHEAKFRGEDPSAIGLFFFQLEVLCRNRLSYDLGMQAMAGDPFYDPQWHQWLMAARQKLGIVDIADLIYVHSRHYANRVESDDGSADEVPVVLFGEKEGRIALANRRKDPLYLFSALQRHLSYPSVPKIERRDPQQDLLPRLTKTVERLEARLKLLEDEQREKGIDLSQFYQPPEPGA